MLGAPILFSTLNVIAFEMCVRIYRNRQHSRFNHISRTGGVAMAGYMILIVIATTDRVLWFAFMTLNLHPFGETINSIECDYDD